MTILTAPAQLADASMADLLETYNLLTGQSVKRFASVAVGQRRVENAMLAAKDADGHTGVPKGTEPQPRGRKDIEAKAAAKGVPVPAAPDSEGEVTFPPGTLGEKLTQEAAKAAPITPRPKKAPPTSANPGRGALYAVQATFAGTSKPQAGSIRNNVLLRVQQSKNAAGVVTSAATVEALDKHFGHSTRGYIQKLLDKNHLRPLTQEEFEKAQPVAQPKKG